MAGARVAYKMVNRFGVRARTRLFCFKALNTRIQTACAVMGGCYQARTFSFFGQTPGQFINTVGGVFDELWILVGLIIEI